MRTGFFILWILIELLCIVGWCFNIHKLAFAMWIYNLEMLFLYYWAVKNDTEF